MNRDHYGLIPGVLSVFIHVVLIGGLFIAFDFSQSVKPVQILSLEAILVEELPPVPLSKEPVIDKEAIEQENKARQLRAEEERIRKQKIEEKRQQEIEAAERKRIQEIETERLRAEAERKRIQELEAQRKENQRLRQEAEEAEIRRRRAAERLAEENRILAVQANDKARWVFALQQAISRNFVPPASSPINLECVVDVRQLPGGTVANVRISRCNGDAAVERAIEAAVYKASPLPAPDNPRIFDRNLRITFKPEY